VLKFDMVGALVYHGTL